ncbi:hypothetical protein GIB67_043052, partial [Kingdonia uniflora]
MAPLHEGMEFESIDQARKYYEEYGRKEGFWIKIRTSTKSKPRSDLVTRVRWTQGANKFRVNDSKGLSTDEVQDEALRLSHMCRVATQWACQLAKSEKGYKHYMDVLRKMEEFVDDVENDFENDVENDVILPVEDENLVQDKNLDPKSSQVFLLDPNVSQEDKGGSKVSSTKRIKSGIELSQQKKKRQCKTCLGYGHDSRTCPKNSKKRKKEASPQVGLFLLVIVLATLDNVSGN